eukprot:611800-Amphidinium_carterae.1
MVARPQPPPTLSTMVIVVNALSAEQRCQSECSGKAVKWPGTHSKWMSCVNTTPRRITRIANPGKEAIFQSSLSFASVCPLPTIEFCRSKTLCYNSVPNLKVDKHLQKNAMIR